MTVHAVLDGMFVRGSGKEALLAAGAAKFLESPVNPVATPILRRLAMTLEFIKLSAEDHVGYVLRGLKEKRVPRGTVQKVQDELVSEVLKHSGHSTFRRELNSKLTSFAGETRSVARLSFSLKMQAKRDLTKLLGAGDGAQIEWRRYLPISESERRLVVLALETALWKEIELVGEWIDPTFIEDVSSDVELSLSTNRNLEPNVNIEILEDAILKLRAGAPVSVEYHRFLLEGLYVIQERVNYSGRSPKDLVLARRAKRLTSKIGAWLSEGDENPV